MLVIFSFLNDIVRGELDPVFDNGLLEAADVELMLILLFGTVDLDESLLWY